MEETPCDALLVLFDASPDAVRCRFCRQLRAKGEVTVVGSMTLCADCLGLMETIMAEAAQPSRPAT
jgi:hypothetical protein